MRFFLILTPLFCLNMFANDLTTIAKFANEICGTVQTYGYKEKVDINIKFIENKQEELYSTLKELGFQNIKIEDNRIIEKRFISSGVDIDDLPSVMQKIRECKRSIAQELLNTTMY